MDRPQGLHVVSATGPQADVRLDSWKEIAAYLNRTVRTAQRWEESEGLPIHRHGHDQRDSVYAFTRELDEWLRNRSHLVEREPPILEPPPPVKAATERGGERKWILIGACLSLGIVFAALGGWHLWTRSDPALPFASRDWVALADFDNQTGDSLFDRSLASAFAVGLQQSRHVNLLPRSRMETSLRRMGRSPGTRIDEAVGREICLRENVRCLVLCSISRVGRQYAVSARLIEPRTGAVVKARLELADNQDRVLNALGALAGGLRRDLGESLASIRQEDRPLPLVTTPSLEALRAYAEGNYLWEKGQHKPAFSSFRTALGYDPDFAMAHAALANTLMSHVFLGVSEAKEHYERARQLSARITARERLLLEAQYLSNLGHVEQAVAAYRLYCQSYPDDVAARGNLARILLVNERQEEAIKEYEEVTRVYPASASALVNIATGYFMLNKPAKAVPYYERAFALEPSWLAIRNLNHEYGFTLATGGNRPKAREVFALAIAKPETRASGLRSIALLDMLEGKYRTAREHLVEAIALTEDPNDRYPHARNHLFMAILRQGQDDRTGMLRELDRAADALAKTGEPLVDFVARTGAIYARAGRLDKAEALARIVAARVDRQSPQQLAELHALEGEIALARSDHNRAIELLAAALKEADNPLTLASLCHAYDVASDEARAIEHLERLIAKGSRAAGWEPQQAWLEAHVQAAELWVGRGDPARAAQTLAPLADLWKEADPGLPLARRIARLQSTLHADQ